MATTKRKQPPAPARLAKKPTGRRPRPANKPAPKSAAPHPVDKPLTQPEQRFVLHYTTGETLGNAQAALLAAGYSPTSIKGKPYELLARPNVAKAVAEAQARVRATAEEEAGVTLGQVVARIAQVAMFDARTMFTESGGLKPPKEWSDAAAAALSGIEVTELTVGKGPDAQPIGELKKVKWIQCTVALEMLMKHLGGYEKDNSQKGDAATQAMTELMNAIRQVQSDACRLPIAPTHPG